MPWCSKLNDKSATLRVGKYKAVLTPADFAWTGRPANELHGSPATLALVNIKDLTGDTAKVELEQDPGPCKRPCWPST